MPSSILEEFVPPYDRRRQRLTGAWLAFGLVAACGSSSSNGSSDDGGSTEDGAGHAPSDGLAPAGDANVAEASGVDTDARGAPDDAGEGGAAVDRDDSGIVAEAGTTMAVYLTFYGWADNSPPGAAIAYSKSGGFPTVHDAAGGTGTFADPITFATDKAEFPPGTILYVPFLEKYLVMEDDCVECDSDWSGSHKLHVDVWMNSNASEDKNALIQCEDKWTRTTTDIEEDPPANRVVTTAPLFDPATNTCRTSP